MHPRPLRYATDNRPLLTNRNKQFARLPRDITENVTRQMTAFKISLTAILHNVCKHSSIQLECHKVSTQNMRLGLKEEIAVLKYSKDTEADTTGSRVYKTLDIQLSLLSARTAVTFPSTESLH